MYKLFFLCPIIKGAKTLIGCCHFAKLHIPPHIRSRFPVISVHCLFKNGIVNVKLILFSQTLSLQLES
ncbi:MAG: hypothetical protein KBH01_03070, partial [Breznakibacter sp.]|nr:hypothetical protein [Breznakibacter sp.]